MRVHTDGTVFKKIFHLLIGSRDLLPANKEKNIAVNERCGSNMSQTSRKYVYSLTGCGGVVIEQTCFLAVGKYGKQDKQLVSYRTGLCHLYRPSLRVAMNKTRSFGPITQCPITEFLISTPPLSCSHYTVLNRQSTNSNSALQLPHIRTPSNPETQPHCTTEALSPPG